MISELQSQDLSVYMIRHGESEYNIAQMKAFKSEKEIKENEDVEVKFCKELIDCSLSEKGVQQSLKCGEEVRNLDIAYILVSPLRRALMTCQNILKNHPNPPKVIVHPGIRERMQSNCDIGSPAEDLEKEFPNFDFSLLKELENHYWWYLYGLPRDIHDQMLKHIAETYTTPEDQKALASGLILEKMKAGWPVKLEPQAHLVLRVQEFVIDLKERIKKLTGKSKILMIGHSRCWETLTAESYGPDGEPIGAKWLNNCELYEYHFK